ESYALAIALLSDRLRGGQGLTTAWPTDDPGLSRAQRRELQTLLLARGHAIGAVDGKNGTNTRRAIQAEQQRLGLSAADGRASSVDGVEAVPGDTNRRSSVASQRRLCLSPADGRAGPSILEAVCAAATTP